MGKRLSKKELLKEIDSERSSLMELLESIPKARYNTRGINSADWSIKDVVTHLLDWEDRAVGWIEVGRTGEIPEVPGDGFKWNQTKELNAFIQKRHSRTSIKKVLLSFDEVHLRTLKLIHELTNKELTSIEHFSWTGKSWTVSDYLRGNTASHYKWGRNKIRKWLKQLDAKC